MSGLSTQQVHTQSFAVLSIALPLLSCYSYHWYVHIYYLTVDYKIWVYSRSLTSFWETERHYGGQNVASDDYAVERNLHVFKDNVYVRGNSGADDDQAM